MDDALVVVVERVYVCQTMHTLQRRQQWRKLSYTCTHTPTDKRKRGTDDGYDNDSMSNFLLYFEIEATVRITHGIHMYVYVDRINSSL